MRSPSRSTSEREPAEPAGVSGREAILEIEDLQNRLAERTVQREPFWRALIDDPAAVPENVFHGLCAENYHLLFRESYFDAPILSYAGSAAARRLFNAFYVEEFGHDALLLRALSSLGITAEDLFETTPLPETAALYNALAYWARYDPLFFFTTLGPLEGREVEIDSFVGAARRRGLPAAFVEPIAAHARINKDSGHGLLARTIFDAIPVVAAADLARLRRLTELFVRLYARFYGGVWRHYAGGGAVVRRVTEL